MDVLEQLKKANRDRIKDYGHEDFECWNLPEWACAVAGETGELCNVIKKVHRGDYTLDEANKQELISDEAADIVIYLDILCQRAGLDLAAAIVNKFNKSSKKIGSPIEIYYY